MFYLPPHFADEIIAHARAEAPNEACGLLAGAEGRVLRLYRARNADHSPLRYSIEPKELLGYIREIDAQGWELLVIYHSHTHTEAYPSATDLELAFYPDSIYLIVSLRDPQRPLIRGFRIVEGAITEEEVVVAPRSAVLESELRRFPLTQKYFGRLFAARVDMPAAQDTDLVTDIVTPGKFDRLEALLQQVNHVSGFYRLFQRGIGRRDPDGPIPAIFAELSGLQYLLKQGYTNIEVLATLAGRTPEFAAELDGIPCLIEVKSLHREESQNQLGTILGGVYVFAPPSPPGPVGAGAQVGARNTAMVRKLIVRKVWNAVKQIEEYAARKGLFNWRGVVIVVATRQRVDLAFWDNVCFDALKQACNRLAAEKPGARLGTGVFIAFGSAQTYNLP